MNSKAAGMHWLSGTTVRAAAGLAIVTAPCIIIAVTIALVAVICMVTPTKRKSFNLAVLDRLNEALRTLTAALTRRPPAEHIDPRTDKRK